MEIQVNHWLWFPPLVEVITLQSVLQMFQQLAFLDMLQVFIILNLIHQNLYFIKCLTFVTGGPTNNTTQSLVTRKAPTMPKPQWHPPWKLYRVISGHIGWVRCVAVDPTNEWFCTGSADRVIKVNIPS